MFQLKMMKRFSKLILFIFFISIIITSCVKQKSFPTSPVITFKEVDKFESTFHRSNGIDSTFLDSMYVVIKFTDGDGDIGGNTSGKSDFLMKYLRMDNSGNFVPYNSNPNGIYATPFDTLFQTYNVPYITPEGQYKALEGEIRAQFKGKDSNGNVNILYLPTDKVIKYEITLRDRAGNISNKVTTNEIAVP